MKTSGAGGAQVAAERLGALAEDLGRRGFAAVLDKRGGYPCVSVTNRAAARLSEHVYAAPAGDGSWWFWWSWADRIAPVDDVEATARRISHVLMPDA